MTLSLERGRIVSQKVGSQADAAEVGPTGESKKWLTTGNALKHK